MFIIRNAIENDLEDLFDLSKQALLLNLPRDKKIIQKKIEESIFSFKNPDTKKISNNHDGAKITKTKNLLLFVVFFFLFFKFIILNNG